MLPLDEAAVDALRVERLPYLKVLTFSQMNYKIRIGSDRMQSFPAKCNGLDVKVLIHRFGPEVKGLFIPGYGHLQVIDNVFHPSLIVRRKESLAHQS